MELKMMQTTGDDIGLNKTVFIFTFQVCLSVSFTQDLLEIENWF